MAQELGALFVVPAKFGYMQLLNFMSVSWAGSIGGKGRRWNFSSELPWEPRVPGEDGGRDFGSCLGYVVDTDREGS